MNLPEPPYYAVIFGSRRSAQDDAGYAATAARMVELAARQPGYLGMLSARNNEGVGITVSYWASEADIQRWRQHAEHQIARETGRQRWYSEYSLQVARVERAYAWSAHDADPMPELPGRSV
jgi:heme-degrading monooxygenase HmoA